MAPIRFYITPYEVSTETPSGSGNVSRAYDILKGVYTFRCTSIRANPWKSWCLAVVETVEAGHTLVQADVDIRLVPLWDGSSNYLSIDDRIDNLSSTSKQNMKTWLEEKGVPMHHFTGTLKGVKIRQAFNFICRLLQIVTMLKDDYPNIDLDLTIGDIPSDQRSRIIAWCDANGIKRDDITNSTLIRDALVLLTMRYRWEKNYSKIWANVISRGG